MDKKDLKKSAVDNGEKIEHTQTSDAQDKTVPLNPENTPHEFFEDKTLELPQMQQTQELPRKQAGSSSSKNQASQGAPTTAWESMPLPPQYAKQKKFPLGLVAALIGITLCLVGAVMAFTPMITAGGPLNLAYESGYRDPEYVDNAFRIDEVQSITLENSVTDRYRERHYGTYDVDNEQGKSRVKYFDGVYINRVVMEESPDDKIHIRYYENRNQYNPRIRHLELKDGTVSISPVLEQYGEVSLTNLYLIYADQISHFNNSGAITLEIPKGWKGTVNFSNQSMVTVHDMTFEGKLDLNAGATVSRLEIIDSHFTQDVVLDSENIKAIKSIFDGDLKISALSDKNSVYISDTTAKSMSFTGDGQMSILQPHTNSLTAHTTKGCIVAFFDGTPQDYQAKMNAYVMTDFAVVERYDKGYEKSYDGGNQYLRTDSGTLEYVFPLTDPLFKDSAAELAGKKQYFDSYREQQDFIEQKILPHAAFTYESPAPHEGAPSVSLVSARGSMNVGFLGDDSVLGYKTPQTGAKAYFNYLIKRQNNTGYNSLPRPVFINIAKKGEGQGLATEDDFSSLKVNEGSRG